jgi:hypothetical protein
MTTQQESVSSQTYAVPNIVYDLITLIHEKSKGLEAFDQYMKDAQGNQEVANILQQCQQQDKQSVSQLTQCLGRLLSQSGGSQ